MATRIEKRETKIFILSNFYLFFFLIRIIKNPQTYWILFSWNFFFPDNIRIVKINSSKIYK